MEAYAWDNYSKDDIDVEKFWIPHFLGFDHDTTRIYPISSSWTEYLMQRGWTQEEIDECMSGSEDGRSAAEFLGLWQSWHLFGFLEQVYRVRIRSDDFLLCRNGIQYLAVAAYFWTLFRAHQDYIVSLTKDERTNEFARIDELRHSVHTLTKELCDRFVDGVTLLKFASLNQCVLVMTQLYHLHDFIAYLPFLIDMDDRKRDLMQWRMPPYIYSHPAVKWISKAIRMTGWCPSLERRMDPFLARFATCFISIPLDSPYRHKNCTSDSCVAHNIDAATYEARHAPGCDPEGCSNITVPIASLFHCIEADALPVVRCRWSRLDNKAKLSIVAYHPGIEFVAFSHVWIDGHGSVAEDGLPRCLLQNLISFAEDAMCLVHKVARPSRRSGADGEVYMWIDSLCIPKSSFAPIGLSLRKRAMLKLSSVYEAATATVVIDNDMLSFTTRPSDRQEISAMRVHTSE